jgi:hypothetical protein
MDLSQLQGLLSAQPDEAEQRMAKMQGLLGLGIGLLQGSRGNYGAFAPALAQGLQGGMQNFIGAQQMGQFNRRARAQEAISLARLQREVNSDRRLDQEAAERAAERQRRQTWQDSVLRATQPPAPMPMPVQGSMGGLDSYDPPNAAPTPAPQLTPALLRQLGIQGLGIGGETLLSQADRMEAQSRPQMVTTERTNPTTGRRERVAVPVTPGQETVLGELQEEPAPQRTTNRGIEEFRNGQWVPTGLRPYQAPTGGGGSAVQPVTVVRDGKPVIIDARSGRVIGDAPQGAGKPMSPTAVRIQDEAIESMQPLTLMNSRIDTLLNELGPQGNLRLGPVSNIQSRVANAVGWSTPQSRAFEDLKVNLEAFRNSILMAHKGVQTEGDATRAMNQIVANINDPAVVRQALERLRELNEQAARLQMTRVNAVRSEYGAAPMDFAPIIGNTNNLQRPGTIGSGGGGAQGPQQGQTLNLGRQPAMPAMDAIEAELRRRQQGGR